MLCLGAQVDARKRGPDSAGPVKALAGFSALDSGHGLSLAFLEGEKGGEGLLSSISRILMGEVCGSLRGILLYTRGIPSDIRGGCQTGDGSRSVGKARTSGP